jgi:acetamidase/formamidase
VLRVPARQLTIPSGVAHHIKRNADHQLRCVPTQVNSDGQTGPFFVDGAEPGDAIRIEDSRGAAYGIVSFPFGALNASDRTAATPTFRNSLVLQVDKIKGVARSLPTEAPGVPLAPFWAARRLAGPRSSFDHRARQFRWQHGLSRVAATRST